MRDLSVISAGYIGGSLSDHGNYEERIRKHLPVEAKDFSITSHYYGDIGFNFNFDGKSVGLDAALEAEVTNDVIAWLEAICLGYHDSIFVIDAEGPLEMFRLYSSFDGPSRFTVLTSREYSFVKGNKQKSEKQEEDEGEEEIWFSWNHETETEYEKSKETQIVCDILVSKKEFVRQLWQAIQKALKKTPDDLYTDMNADAPIRQSSIIEEFLRNNK